MLPLWKPAAVLVSLSCAVTLVALYHSLCPEHQISLQDEVQVLPECPPVPLQEEPVDEQLGFTGYTDLCRIAARYGTDKSPLVPAKYVRHYYTPLYHSFFHNKRAQVKKLLELGVGFSYLGDMWKPAASGRMWRDYFCNARIYLFDKNPEGFVYNESRIQCILSDQSSPHALQNSLRAVKLIDPEPDELFDVIVDDGSHELQHQLVSLMALWDQLKVGGVYIIEDIVAQGPSWEGVRVLVDLDTPLAAEQHHVLRAVRENSEQFLFNSTRSIDGFIAYFKLK